MPVSSAAKLDVTRPFHIMAKPIGPRCNLDCRYCFYLEKEKLYPRGENFRMPDAVLERYIREYIEAQETEEVTFAWQGGEPTLLGVDFFRRAVALQRRYAGGRRIANALQTNGTLLDDAWCLFLAENRFLVGLSIDGPRDLHDVWRVDKHGGATFDAVMRGLECLRRHRVEFNTLTVVHRRNSREPVAVYRFLTSIGSRYLQFIPLVERLPDAGARGNGLDFAAPLEPPAGDPSTGVTEWSVEPAAYGEFLVQVFEEWVPRDVGRIFVQLFDVALGNWLGVGSSLCVFAERCGRALALEHNGDVFSCDHYVYPQFKLGNLLNRSLGELVDSARQQKFGNDKSDTLPRYCRECDVRFACHGECPKHRFLRTPDGEPGLNYLCAAYQRFFRHIDPYLRVMARLIEQERAPAEIMDLIAVHARSDIWRETAAGAPCPCGSGGRYADCCLPRRLVWRPTPAAAPR